MQIIIDTSDMDMFAYSNKKNMIADPDNNINILISNHLL